MAKLLDLLWLMCHGHNPLTWAVLRYHKRVWSGKYHVWMIAGVPVHHGVATYKTKRVASSKTSDIRVWHDERGEVDG